MTEHGIPESKKIKDAIARFEKQTGISVRHHLGFGNYNPQK